MNANQLPTRVVVVEDHHFTRLGIEVCLNSDSNIQHIISTSSIAEFWKYYQPGCCDIILLDLNLPDGNGMDLFRKLIEKGNKPPVLILTMHDQDSYITEALELGVNGYMLKNSTQAELTKAIHRVAEGGEYYDLRVTQMLVTSFKKRKAAKGSVKNELSPREKEVMRLVVQEYSNHEIADQLHLSVRTVENHKRTLMQKLGVKNSIGLVKKAFEEEAVWM
jgi:DNA-binding NarL/FixJ family response regulator